MELLLRDQVTLAPVLGELRPAIFLSWVALKQICPSHDPILGTKKGFLLFSLPNREPKEDGGRNATNPRRRNDPLADASGAWCGVLAVSPASWRLRDR
jgi:hypothetical protein